MKDYTNEIFCGHEILNWIDSEVKVTPFIDIIAHRIHQETDNTVHVNYRVAKRSKINCQYMYRHLALQHVNLN